MQEYRHSGAFRSKKDLHRYQISLFAIIVLSILFALGLLLYKNPVPITSASFIPVVNRRISALIAMGLAALCQSTATITFQSITNNKIITPSLLGFDALYAAINTGIVFFFGASTLIKLDGLATFFIQVLLMILLSVLLYGTLLKDSYKDMQLVLLIGIIIGTGLHSISSFMRRILAPSEFDILQAKLFGSVNNADSSYYVVAVPLVLICVILLMCAANKLDTISLGKDVSTVLGLKHKREVIYSLILVSILMAVSTALVGSLTFYGFLIATLTYELVPSFKHIYYYPFAIVLGFLIITFSYFIMYHVFSAQGVVSIIIELFGGITFLSIILRRSA